MALRQPLISTTKRAVYGIFNRQAIEPAYRFFHVSVIIPKESTWNSARQRYEDTGKGHAMAQILHILGTQVLGKLNENQERSNPAGPRRDM